MALWGGRFEGGVDAFTQEFGASLEEDKVLAHQDIAGSKAHAKMLGQQGVISQEDAQAIREGLDEIDARITAGTFVWDVNDEDVHMAVEGELTRAIGTAGARLHTGRSRNDQVATDIRLWAKDQCEKLMNQNLALRQVLIQKAEDYFDVVMPGYTHLQHAQPVLFSHHMLAYYWMFTRDYARLKYAYMAADVNPLGSAALAGTTYPLDRFATTQELGFKAPSHNSLDAVSDRDYLLDLEYACSVSMMHLSRLCEELILWSSTEFGFITMSDSFSTGSSIMPQKKNPDFAELIRGKVGRVYGDLTQLLVTMKGLPLAYNKDLQECKVGAIDAAKTLYDCMYCMEGMIATMSLHEDVMLAQSAAGFTAATDVADYLAKRGIPFRVAHEVVGNTVLYCEKAGKGLEDLSLEELKRAAAEVSQEAADLYEADIASALDPSSIARARNTYGGTGHDAVAQQLQEAKDALAKDAGSVSSGRIGEC